MKKVIAVALVLMLCLAFMPMAFAADDLITVGIINLDPAESGYREANVKNLTDTFTKENGYDATFAEMGNEMKNTISHRAKAVRKLVEFLKNSSQKI